MAALLSLMIANSAEDCQLCLVDWNHSEEIKLTSDVLLDNVRTVMKRVKVRTFSYGILFVFHGIKIVMA